MSIPLIATTILTNLPVQGEMLDENGHLTQQWRLFFQALYTRTGGQTAPTNAVLGTVSTTTTGNVTALTATSAANAATVSSQGTLITGNTSAINNLITATNANTSSISSLKITTSQNTSAIAAINVTLNATPAAVMPITVGASPFTYKATVKGAVAVSGGVVQSIQLTRDGTTFYNVGLLDGIVAMSTNDSVLVTFTTAPVITFFPT